MKLWLDDLRPAPAGYEIWCHSVNDAKSIIRHYQKYPMAGTIDLIDCDHDLGDYAKYGGDGVALLDWMEEYGYSYPIRLHTMNPVGRERMRAVIQHNHWTEIP